MNLFSHSENEFFSAGIHLGDDLSAGVENLPF